jgi:hypothetical protein
VSASHRTSRPSASVLMTLGWFACPWRGHDVARTLCLAVRHVLNQTVPRRTILAPWPPGSDGEHCAACNRARAAHIPISCALHTRLKRRTKTHKDTDNFLVTV